MANPDGCGGPIDLGGGARKHHLRGCVAVRNHQIQGLRGDDFFDLSETRPHREHRAASAILVTHQLATQAGELVEVFARQPTAGAKRSEFTETVTGGRNGCDPEPAKQRERTEADGPDGRLRVPRITQHVLLKLARVVIECGMRIYEVTEGLVDVPCVGELERCPQGRELTREVAEHADVLGALSGKQQGQIARRRTTTIVDAVRRGPRRLSVGVEQARGARSQRCRVRLALLHDENQSLGVVRAEGLAGVLAEFAHRVPVGGLAQARQPLL